MSYQNSRNNQLQQHSQRSPECVKTDQVEACMMSKPVSRALMLRQRLEWQPIRSRVSVQGSLLFPGAVASNYGDTCGAGDAAFRMACAVLSLSLQSLVDIIAASIGNEHVLRERAKWNPQNARTK